MPKAIVKLSSLGDIIHLALLLPMFEARLQEGECDVNHTHSPQESPQKQAEPIREGIEWFVDESFSEILNHSPYISHIHQLPIKRLAKQRDYKGLLHCFKQLRDYLPYSQIIDAQGLIKSALVTYCLPSKRKLGFSYSSAREGISALFYNEHCHIDYNEHILRRNAKLLCQAYEIPYTPEKLDDFLAKRQAHNLIALDSSSQAKTRMQELIPSGYENILFMLESSKPNKIYPASQFIQLAKLLDKPHRKIYLLWHEQESSAIEITKACPACVCLPRLNLDEVKALLCKMNLVIGGDTGVVHLAFALNTPSITLFGNTPIERLAILNSRHQALRAEGSKDYDKHDFSIRTLSPELIAHTAHAILSESKEVAP